jgi:DNA-binding NtrC family response regulator
MNRKVLIVDDDESLRKVAAFHLKEQGFQVSIAGDGLQARGALEKERFDLVVTDLKMPRMDGLELLNWIKGQSPETQVIVMTGFATIDDAVAAMKQGAFDFITKPLNYEQFKISVAKALDYSSLKRRVTRLESELEEKFGRDSIIHSSPAMGKVLDIAEKVAASDATVLITGESGTGKEMLARMIHYHSGRRDEALVTVNCAAIPRDLLESELFGHTRGAFTGAVRDKQGKFELADGGTLLLDEIGELPLELQAKLLRALESGEIDPVGGSQPVGVDIRVIAATNRDLAKQVSEGKFREDLYFRINVIHIEIPPLRERPEDVETLAKHFFRTLSGNENIGVEQGVYQELKKRPWPGNIRELRNTCEQMLILREGEDVGVADLPAPAMAGRARSVVSLPRGGYPLDKLEREAIEQAIAMAGGNNTKAAELLRIPRHKLLYRLQKHGLF